MPPDPIRTKISRLSQNEPPRVLDLFAGCGGLSLGLSAAGFRIEAAMEIDKLAARSHAKNFYRHEDPSKAEMHAKARDITAIEPDELVNDLGLGPPQMAFDVIVGGPPCQAYARVGRAKLREIAEHPEAFKIDPRADLYLRYLHYIDVLKPVAIMMENVPDIMNHGGRVIPEEMREMLDLMGYDARYCLINSAFYGVPQMRDRVFLVAFHKLLKAEIRFPQPTHYVKLPPGYQGTRDVAFKNINLFNPASGYMSLSDPTPDLVPAVTAKDAIGDLPVWTKHQTGELKRGARTFNELFRYRPLKSLSDYMVLMRNWPGFESSGGVYDHVIRSLPRDGEIFRNMKNGDEYPAALKVAVSLFEAEAKRLRVKEGTDLYSNLRRQMVPPYPVNSFPNRWWKLRPDAPVRTLMAHIGKDTYSHIHYDSEQARCISVREAARLQSFPDGFVFEGTMNPAFRQIGNAVPPLMARAIGSAIKQSLTEAIARQGVQDNEAA
jgi:DNA (cytosine-5)-methyltransferase 1